MTKPSRRSNRTLLAAALLGACLPSAGGCSRVAVPRTTEEGLREQLSKMTRERDDLARENRDYKAKLEAKASSASGVLMSAEAEGVLPRLPGIFVGGMSFVEADSKGVWTLHLVIEPVDGRRRFIPLTGDLRIGANIDISTTESAPVGDATVGPKALSDAYRTGFMGTHYSFDLPLKLDGRTVPAEVHVKCEFVDAQTGNKLLASGLVRVRRTTVASDE